MASSPDCPPPPKSPFEIRIAIGAESWEYLLLKLDEIALHVRDHGPGCGLVGGGAGTNYSVHIEVTDKTPEQYSDELKAWHEGKIAARERGIPEHVPPDEDVT